MKASIKLISLVIFILAGMIIFLPEPLQAQRMGHGGGGRGGGGGGGRSMGGGGNRMSGGGDRMGGDRDRSINGGSRTSASRLRRP